MFAQGQENFWMLFVGATSLSLAGNKGMKKWLGCCFISTSNIMIIHKSSEFFLKFCITNTHTFKCIQHLMLSKMYQIFLLSTSFELFAKPHFTLKYSICFLFVQSIHRMFIMQYEVLFQENDCVYLSIYFFNLMRNTKSDFQFRSNLEINVFNYAFLAFNLIKFKMKIK